MGNAQIKQAEKQRKSCQDQVTKDPNFENVSNEKYPLTSFRVEVSNVYLYEPSWLPFTHNFAKTKLSLLIIRDR